MLIGILLIAFSIIMMLVCIKSEKIAIEIAPFCIFYTLITIGIVGWAFIIN
ncbi:MAG: hypothetical protein LKF42_00485 [Streptococcaceae bacterium]|nr:hypothetical protein [Streptococcaceae bacterium]MCH4176209.1 hypothetical protein [Streptococcaceae bacterium]